MANVRFPRDNFDATSDPGVGDDINDGYGPGSRWYNTSSGELFMCDDASVGAASWINLSTAGGGLSKASQFIYGHLAEEFAFGTAFGSGKVVIPNTDFTVTDTNFPSNSIMTIDAGFVFRVNSGGGPTGVAADVHLSLDGATQSVGRSYDTSGIAEFDMGVRFQVIRDSTDKYRRVGQVIGNDENAVAIFNVFDDLGSPLPTLPARPFTAELEWFVGYNSADVSIGMYTYSVQISQLTSGSIAS